MEQVAGRSRLPPWQCAAMIIHSARDAADLLVPLFASCDGEKVFAAHLDAGQRLIRTVEAGQGEGCEVKLPIRSIIGDALRLGSSGLIVAHNHPSGDAMPSEADLAATRELAAAASTLGIHLHDHLVVGAGGDCRSFRTLGLL